MVVKTKWKGDTGGKPWMQKAMILWFRHTPLFVPYFCMAWVVPFYMIIHHAAYLSTYRYFRQRFKYGVIRSFANVYLNHFRFGQIVIDRFAMYAGKKFIIDVDGQGYFDELDQKKEGFLILSSHIGNYELAGYSLIPHNKTFNALIFGGETKQVMEGRKSMFEGKRINMIPVRDDMSHIFKINNALEEGNIVSIPGDRIFGSPRFVEAELLGAKARFPLGPLAIAIQRNIPVLAVFVMKESITRYTIKVRRLHISEETDRKNKTNALAVAFAKELDDVLKKYPEQWFNYYNFWES